MASAIQLDLFRQDMSLEEELREELKRLEVAQNNLRKGIFARHGDLSKQFMYLMAEIELLKLQILEMKTNEG